MKFLSSLATLAGVAVTVVSTLAPAPTVLSSHLKPFKVTLCRSNPQDGCRGGGALSEVRIHLASSTATAALAGRSTATVSVTTRHSVYQREERERASLKISEERL